MDSTQFNSLFSAVERDKELGMKFMGVSGEISNEEKREILNEKQKNDGEIMRILNEIGKEDK